MVLRFVPYKCAGRSSLPLILTDHGLLPYKRAGVQVVFQLIKYPLRSAVFPVNISVPHPGSTLNALVDVTVGSLPVSVSVPHAG